MFESLHSEHFERAYPFRRRPDQRTRQSYLTAMSGHALQEIKKINSEIKIDWPSRQVISKGKRVFVQNRNGLGGNFHAAI